MTYRDDLGAAEAQIEKLREELADAKRELAKRDEPPPVPAPSDVERSERKTGFAVGAGIVVVVTVAISFAVRAAWIAESQSKFVPYKGHVTKVVGTTPTVVGESCSVYVRDTGSGDKCEITITCAQKLYGFTIGIASCTTGWTGKVKHVRDTKGLAEDRDPKLEIDFPSRSVVVSDDGYEIDIALDPS